MGDQYAILDSLIGSFTNEERMLFRDITSGRLFNIVQYIKIAEIIIKGIDIKVLQDFNYNINIIDSIIDLVERGAPTENIKYILTFTKETINKFLKYHEDGYCILPFIDVEYDRFNSTDVIEYIEMLFYCFDNNINIDSLIIYNYSVRNQFIKCLILGHDVSNITSLVKPNDIDCSDLILKTFLSKNVNYNVYSVFNDNADYEESESYVILASSERDAKLYSCISGGFSPLYISVKCYTITSDNEGIIHTSYRYS